MNVSLLNLSKVQKFNFTSNMNSINPIEKHSESLQNNGPEVKIPLEAYLSLQTNLVFNSLEESGAIEFDENDCIDLKTDFAPEDKEFDQTEFSANMAIASLKTVALMFKKQFSTQEKVPTFVRFDCDNYLTNLERNITEAQKQLHDIDLSDLCELDGYDDMTEEELEEYNVYMQPDVIAKNVLGMLPQIIDGQRAMLMLFKTTKKNELSQALNELSFATNLMLYNVIKNGFNGNARAVVANLSSNIEMTSTPEILDNEDGTISYLYKDLMMNVTEVVKNKYNGDYIAAKCANLAGEKAYEVEFNPNGSIKNLEYINNADNSKVLISQDNNKVVVKQVFNGAVTERRFIQQEDGSLKQTFMNIYLKSI